MSLADLFPAGDHRFHLTLRRGEPDAFFKARDGSGRVLAERRRWIEAEPGRYARLEGGGEPLLAEWNELCRGWGMVPAGDQSIEALGMQLEPDWLLLSTDPEGRFVLRGGALCFPTGWALEEKIGQTLDSIHGVVPGLNAALGAPIRQFLGKLKPGVAYHRDNWGIAASDEFNLHPSRGISPPQLPLQLDRLWLRVEQQALVALPKTGGITFGIRIELHALAEVSADESARSGLRRALQTMSEDLAIYKRLQSVRDELVERLR
jgi:hypothetical protein